MARVLLRGSLAFFLALWAGAGWAFGQETPIADAEEQRKVVQLLQTVIQEYWNGAEAKNGATNHAAENSTNVETAFRLASKLMPERLDLRFGLASSLVSEAVQTNGPQLELKIKEALGVYQRIEAMDTNNFEAPIWHAAYARAIGETNEAQTVLGRLMKSHSERTREYVDKFNLLEELLRMAPNEKVDRTMPKDNHHVIVVLGAGLDTNGAIKAKLTSRLEQCLKLARIYRSASIVLTGGNQKGGVTEAYMMSRWCLQRGISRRRLILENKAKDTVENAVFSSAILKRLGVTHVTLVTSANHMRRGLADLEEACVQRGLQLQYAHLAAKAKGDKDLDHEQERVGVYRDFLRASGLWAYPGLQR